MGAQIIEKIALESPVLALAAVGIYFFFRHLRSQHQEHLKSKDKEIERLVKERDRLQEVILHHRLTTEPLAEQPPSKPGKPGKK
jgi:hypothetical protein